MSTKAWSEGALGKQQTGAPRVVFGQVREDAEVELAAAIQAPGSERWFCIASGGCTALSLLLRNPKRLDAIDINPAQIHLLELKRRVLAEESYTEVRNLFEVDGRDAVDRHSAALSAEGRAFWMHERETARGGLLHCGLFDTKLPLAMRLFRFAVHSRSGIESLLAHTDLEEQRRFVHRHWLSWRWRFATSLALHPALLRLVYGREFTERVPADAGVQVRIAFERVLLQFPAASNGYLWQTLLQQYPPGTDALPPYLKAPIQPHQLASLHAQHAEATEWLSAQQNGTIQFFALSNILELAPAELAQRLADEVVRTAAPGAVVMTRAIFPNHSPALSHARLLPDRSLEDALHRMDRTPICRGVRVLRVAG